MPHDVLMPQMGESITEGTLTVWLKKVGDRVERDEPLYEISTDKVDAEIPAPAAGVLLEIKVQPGQTVPINTVVAVLGEAGEAASRSPAASAKPVAPAAKAAGPAPAVVSAVAAKSAPAEAPVVVPRAASTKTAPTPAASPLAERRLQKSSPLVRKIAAEHGIDVGSLAGSGIDGRVTKKDILAVVEGGGQVASQPSAVVPASASAPKAVASPVAVPQGEVPPAYQPRPLEGDRVEQLSLMRSKIAEHMVWSRRISAHVTTVWEVDFERVADLRRRHKPQWAEQHQVPLTYTAFIMRACVDALNAFPLLNASLDGQQVIYHREINLGLAVALDWGLIVPVVHGAGELNLLGLARRAGDLAERARTKKLKPEEVQNGTFTITNPGLYGPMFNMPVINQPQVAILGVGGVEKRPVVIDDMIAIRTRAYLSLSFDHRLVDGAVADQFMAQVKKGIESFEPGEL